MAKKRNIVALIFFLVLTVAFIVVNFMDSAPMWDRLIRSGGWYNTGLHSIMTLGTGPSPRNLRWGNLPMNIGVAFPGIVFAIFPLLAVVFSRQKVVGLIFAILNMVLATLLLFWGFGAHWLLGVYWLLFAVVGLLILLHAAGAIKSRKVLAIVFFALAGTCLMLSGVLACFRMRNLMRGNFEFVGLTGIRYLFRIGFWKSFAYGMVFGVHYFPFSLAVLYAAFGAGMLFFGRLPRQKTKNDMAMMPVMAAPVPAPVQQPEVNIDPGMQATLERLAVLHAQGILTEAEYQQKRAEVLSRR